MANYINRDDIIKWIDDSLEMCGDRYSVDQENMMELFRTVVNDCLPFADVVERKHGKWIPVEEETGVEAFGFKEKAVVYFRCSICDKEVDVSEGNFKYCHNCGAMMEES
jgi:hypothetical protein